MAFEWKMAFDHLPTGADGRIWSVGEGAIAAHSSTNNEVFSRDLGTFGVRRCMGLADNAYMSVGVDPGLQFTVGMFFSPALRWAGALRHLLLFMVGGTEKVSLRLSPATGTFDVRRGSTTVATSAGALISQGSNYVEFTVYMHASEGSFALRVNGVEVFSGGNDLNLSNTAGDVDSIRFHNPVDYSPNNLDFTDLYIRDGGEFLGPIKGSLLNPTSDVSVDWTPDSGATNYTQVQAPAATASYADSDTVDDEDEYGLADLPAGINSIISVTRVTVGEAPDGGAPQISHGIKRGATELYGVERTVGVGGPRTQATHFGTQPDLSPWSVAAVNDLVLLRKAV